MKITGIIIALLLLVTASISGCVTNSETKTEKSVTTDTPAIKETQVPAGGLPETKENSEAGVTVTAVYLGNNAFDIKLDTHSGSLDYEMAKISYIRDSEGNIIKPESWDGGIGGHHLEGTLKFPKFDDSGGFELVIQDVAGVKERVFKW
ncbi:MAG TPA: hypothetical protein VIO58_01730 [Candidatus Methanoperedens sp.]